MDRSHGNVQSRGNRGGNTAPVHAKKGGEKGSAGSTKESTVLSHQTSRGPRRESVSLSGRISNFWYSYETNEAQLSVFRFFFFMLYALNSFEQLPRTYNITGASTTVPHFNLPQFEFPFSLLPPPSPNFLMGSWVASVFLGVRVALGLGGQLDVLLLALMKAYTVFVSQVDNYQHHYLTVLLLFILAHIPWKSLGNTKACSWPVRLLLVQLSVVYFWTAFAKMDSKWVRGEILPLAVGPDFVSYINQFGTNIWSLLSVGTIIAELLLCVIIQIPAFYNYALLIALPMHILMGISGLQIGRFSEMMVALYVLIFPKKILNFVFKIFANVTKLVPYRGSTTILLYMAAYGVFKIFGVLEVLPVALFVLPAICVVELFDHSLENIFVGKPTSSFPHQLISALAIVFLCFHTTSLRNTYIQAGTAALPYKDFNSSIGFFKQAVAIDPYYAEGYGDLGLFLEAVGKHDEAAKGYQHVLDKVDKNNLKSLVGMMRVSDYKKDREQVCNFIKRASPLANKASQAKCVSQECSRAKGHAGYIIHTAKNLMQKWNCDQ